MATEDPKRKFNAERGKTVLPMPHNLVEACLVLTVLGTALRSTLEELLIVQRDKSDDWLNQLEARLISEAKGTIAEGISIDSDARGIGLGVEIVHTHFDMLRRKIAIQD
jgi:hypothetical protein